MSYFYSTSSTFDESDFSWRDFTNDYVPHFLIEYQGLVVTMSLKN